MNKEQIYEFIKSKNIWYEITEHKAVFNMADLSRINIPYPKSDAKNLFVRDDKKRNYYLITVIYTFLKTEYLNRSDFKN